MKPTEELKTMIAALTEERERERARCLLLARRTAARFFGLRRHTHGYR